jgi:hypothetical protein
LKERNFPLITNLQGGDMNQQLLKLMFTLEGLFYNMFDMTVRLVGEEPWEVDMAVDVMYKATSDIFNACDALRPEDQLLEALWSDCIARMFETGAEFGREVNI